MENVQTVRGFSLCQSSTHHAQTVRILKRAKGFINVILSCTRLLISTIFAQYKIWYICQGNVSAERGESESQLNAQAKKIVLGLSVWVCLYRSA